MTNQIAPSAAASCSNQAADRGTEYFVITTILRPLPCGGSVKESHAYVTLVKAGTDRLALFEQVHREIPQRMRNQLRVFFYAEPNQIAPGEYVVMVTLDQSAHDGQELTAASTDLYYASPGTRRTDLYWRMRASLADLGAAVGEVTFFSAELNHMSIPA